MPPRVKTVASITVEKFFESHGEAPTSTNAPDDEELAELADNLRRIHEQGHRLNKIVNAMLLHAREAPSVALTADAVQSAATSPQHAPRIRA